MEPLSQLFTDAGTLMLAGMIFVFAFLGLLVIFIKCVLQPLAKKYPDPKPVARNSRNSRTTQGSKGIDNGTVAAISAAVSQYRKHRQQ